MAYLKKMFWDADDDGDGGAAESVDIDFFEPVQDAGADEDSIDAGPAAERSGRDFFKNNAKKVQALYAAWAESPTPARENRIYAALYPVARFCLANYADYRDHALCDDMIQDAMTGFIHRKGLEKYDPERNVKLQTYFITTLQNSYMNYRNEKMAYKTREGVGGRDDVSVLFADAVMPIPDMAQKRASYPNSDYLVVQAEMKERMSDAYERMTERQREIFGFLYCDELTMRAIGPLYGQGRSMVLGEDKKIMKMLRKFFKNEDVDHDSIPFFLRM